MREPTLLVDPVKRIWHCRELLWQLTVHDVRSRYRGSAMGLLWSIVTPLLMLAVYTAFFNEVFGARLGPSAQTAPQFALALFIGMLLHGLLSECMTRAPALIVSQPNLVKKVVFPLEILPIVSLGSALIHLLAGMAIWLGFYCVAEGMPPPTAPLIVVVLLPFTLMTLGIGWILAALGVYLRDLAHVTPILSSVLLFASPVFYPLSMLREPFRSVVAASPLTLPIEQARAVLLTGHLPDWPALLAYTLVAVLVAALGLLWFAGTSKGFADVV